ncbi:hypothetical protein [Microbacterium sp. T2.11-28]|uniref:hypothetical protein n=1 Tax=Microbacterium sp. T2.11-28 TaxID=3041169 RepID=UPI00247759F3|nr:hypothetical protein [Microbacterium sp. T2.11-28]CAI9394023.1 hypothetical protein MICABA_02649 [Microbacterium sp. T2.11-28]
MRKLLITAGAAIVAGFIVGALAVNAITASPEAERPVAHQEVHAADAPVPRAYETPTPARGVQPGTRGTNEAGLTYGYDAGPSEPLPDLVEAIATNGQIGYYYANDLAKVLQPPADLDPNAAADQSPEAVTIPVYLTDGVTQIGEYPILPATVEAIDE